MISHAERCPSRMPGGICRSGPVSGQSVRKLRDKVTTIWAQPLGRIRSRAYCADGPLAYQRLRTKRRSGGAGMRSRYCIVRVSFMVARGWGRPWERRRQPGMAAHELKLGSAAGAHQQGFRIFHEIIKGGHIGNRQTFGPVEEA